MTEKSKKLIRSWARWITFLVIMVLAPRARENPIKTSADALAALFFMVLIVASAAAVRLASDSVDGQRQGMRVAELLLILILSGAGYAIVVWGVQGSHGGAYALWCVPLLIVVAFNLGRWRGQRDNDVRLSESPHEIWAR
jgi:hypothetical protein